MPTYVALLRAVNVGGRVYKMADLREHLTESGLEDVETHIQTGNVRFRIVDAVRGQGREARRGGARRARRFEVPSVIFTPAQLREVYDDARASSRRRSGRPREQRRYVTFFKVGHIPTGDVAQQIADWDEPGESAVVIGPRRAHLAGPRPCRGEVLRRVQEGARAGHEPRPEGGHQAQRAVGRVTRSTRCARPWRARTPRPRRRCSPTTWCSAARPCTRRTRARWRPR